MNVIFYLSVVAVAVSIFPQYAHRVHTIFLNIWETEKIITNNGNAQQQHTTLLNFILYLCIHNQTHNMLFGCFLVLLLFLFLSLSRSAFPSLSLFLLSCKFYAVVYLSISISQSVSQPVIDRRFAWNQYWFIAHVHSSVCSILYIHFLWAWSQTVYVRVCVCVLLNSEKKHIVKQKHRFVVWLIKKTTCQNETTNNKRTNERMGGVWETLT